MNALPFKENRMRRATSLALPLFCLLTLFTAQAHADTISFSTSGVFSCGAIQQCSAAGSNITFGSGADTLNISFNGTSFTAPLNAGATFYNLSFGTLTTTTTGAGFIIPPIINIEALFNAPRFILNFPQTQPVVANGFIIMVLQGGLQGGSTITFSFLDNRAAGGGIVIDGLFRPIVYTVIPPGGAGRLSVGLGQTDVPGGVAAIPEPTTLLLLGTGFVGAIGAARRRRRNN